MSQCHQPQSSFHTSRTDGVSYRVLALDRKKGFHDSPLGVASSTVRSHWEGSIDSSCMWECDIYRCFEYALQLVLNVVALMPNELDSLSEVTTLNARWKLKGKCLIHYRVSVSFLSGISSPLLWFYQFQDIWSKNWITDLNSNFTYWAWTQHNYELLFYLRKLKELYTTPISFKLISLFLGVASFVSRVGLYHTSCMMCVVTRVTYSIGVATNVYFVYSWCI